MPGTFHAENRIELVTTDTVTSSSRKIDRKTSIQRLRDSGLGGDIGVYVFAMQAGRGVKPWYVGKTIKSFEEECLTPTKLLKFNEVLSGHGKPFLYFLSLKTKKNARAIDELESLMIGVALRRNGRLLNLSKTKQYEVVVSGVINSSSGAPTLKASAFRKMIGLTSKQGLR